MARKKKRAPEVLYTAIEVCTLRDGLVHIAARSGAHVEHGALTVRAAMELYDRLGAELRRLASVRCIGCLRREA